MIFPAPATSPLPMSPVALVVGTVHVAPPSEEISTSVVMFVVVLSERSYSMVTRSVAFVCDALTLKTSGTAVSTMNGVEASNTPWLVKRSVARMRTNMSVWN